MSNENKTNLEFNGEDIIDVIVKSSRGKNDDGKPKSAINLDFFMYDEALDEVREIMNIANYEPYINIQRREPYIQLDICFDIALNNNLRLFWTTLESYGEQMDLYDDLCDNEVPVLDMTILPVEFSGKYVISFKNPIFWVIQPEFPGKDACMLRMLFLEENVDFLEGEEIDTDLIKQEVEFEEEQEENKLIAMIQKELDDEEYEQKRQEMIEALRKNQRESQ